MRAAHAARATQEIHMNEDDNSSPGELRPAHKKLDRNTLLIIMAFIGGLVVLVAFNMK